MYDPQDAYPQTFAAEIQTHQNLIWCVMGPPFPLQTKIYFMISKMDAVVLLSSAIPPKRNDFMSVGRPPSRRTSLFSSYNSAELPQELGSFLDTRGRIMLDLLAESLQIHPIRGAARLSVVLWA